ncbi:MAG: FKBP-type peptidyl-prolyl cis-trans isomerase [Phycisphaerales bacterium]|nr:FKBP-type peptidyl-prolyl cis-trans isomerase [Phycisphaerales bacterium]
MTSEVTLTPDSLETVDRGFGADGKVVWGSSEGQKYTYKKFDSGVKAQRLDGGLVVIDFTHPSGELEVSQADKLTVQYSGFLGNGLKFDTSRDKPQPFTFTQGTLIPGWNVGLLGATKGTIRRLAIPATMAYGERGAGRTIPPNSNLYFEVEILSIERPTPPPPEQPKVDAPAPAAAPATPAEPKKPE